MNRIRFQPIIIEIPDDEDPEFAGKLVLDHLQTLTKRAGWKLILDGKER